MLRFIVVLPALLFAWPSLVYASNWYTLSPLNQSRSEVNAVLVKDKIVVAGGIGRFRTLDSCEIYNQETERWEFCNKLPYPTHHLAIASDGTHVYGAGGYTDLRFSHDESRDLKQFNIDSNRWHSIGEIPEPIGEHALLHHSDYLYLLGGRTPAGDSKKAWKYSLLNKNWLQLADMPRAKHSFSALVVEDELWIIGGRSKALGSGIRTIDIYSPANDSWRDGPELPVGGGGLFAAYHNGHIHIIGGEVFSPNRVLDQHFVYNTEHEKWTTGAKPLVPRHGGAAVIVDQSLLLIGGATKPGLATIYSTSSRIDKLKLSE